MLDRPSKHPLLDEIGEVLSEASATPEVVERVRTLLLRTVDGAPDGRASASHAKQAATRPLGKPSRPGKKTQTAALRDVPRSDVNKDAAPMVDQQEKVVLATEIVNKALQALSAAVSMSSRRPIEPLAGCASNGQAAQHDEPAGSSSRQPAATRRTRDTSPRKSPSNPEEAQHGLGSNGSLSSNNSVRATAECAVVAFEFLSGASTTHSTAGHHVSGGPKQLQLLQGMVALGRMLVALSLNDIALNHFKTTKKQLQAHSKSISSGPGKTKDSQNSTKGDVEKVSTLLEIGDIPEGFIEVVADYQVVLLKLLGQLRRPLIAERVLNHLDPASASSPFNVLLKCSKQPNGTEKAARLFESLAQALFSFCPKISTANDADSCHPSRSPGPSVCLKLQSLAFKARLMWMKIATHEGNIDQEVVKPYARCLSAYLRRSQEDATEQYLLASTAYAYFRDELSTLKTNKGPTVRPDASMYDLYFTLCRSAEQAGRISEACDLAKSMLRECANCQLSDVKTCIARLKMSALTLKFEMCTGAMPPNCKLLQESTGLLSKGVAGDRADIHTMVAESMNLRAQVVALIKVTLKRSNPDESEGIFNALAACREYLTCLVRLHARLRPGETEMDELVASSNGRSEKGLDEDMARKSIESLLFSFNHSKNHDNQFWMSVDNALQSSLVLLSHYGTQPSADLPERPEISDLCVAISDLYLSTSLKFQEESPSDVAGLSLKSLQRSCEALRPCSPWVHRKGRLGFKLERLGRTLITLDNDKEGKGALVTCINVAMHSGELESLRAISASESLDSCFADPKELGYLSKAFKSLLELGATPAAEASGGHALYDNESADTELRGVVLEWQLFIVSKSSRLMQDGSGLLALIPEIGSLLFQLYERSHFPLRRKRVALQLLRLGVDNSFLQQSQAVKIAQESVHYSHVSQLVNDNGLARFSEHLDASLRASAGLQDQQPSSSEFQTAMDKWKVIVHESPSSAMLRERVDNIEGWISHLRSLLTFFEIQGFMSLTATCLEILLSIFKIESDRSKDLVETLIQAGLHYLRAGYSGRALVYLDEAKNELPLVPAQTTHLQYHIARAEYAIAVECDVDIELHLREVRNLIKRSSQATACENSRPTKSVESIVQAANSFLVLSDSIRRKGPDTVALKYARYSVSVMQRVWKALERKSISSLHKESRHDDSVEKVTKDLADMRLHDLGDSKAVGATPKTVTGPIFWPFVIPLYRSLIQLASLCSNLGQFQECYYELEQARKLAQGVRSQFLLASVETRLAELECRSGNVEEGRERIQNAGAIRKSLELHADTVFHHVVLGYSHQVRSEWQAEFDAYERADRFIDQLAAADLNNKQTSSIVLDTCSTKVEKRPVQSKSLPRNDTSKQAKRAKKGRKPSPAKSIQSENGQQAGLEDFTVTYARLSQLRSKERHQRIQSLLIQGKLDAATAVLGAVDKIRIDPTMHARHITLHCSRLLQEAFDLMAKDGVYGILPESVISFPAVSLTSRTNARDLSRWTSSEHALIRRGMPQSSPVKRSNGASPASRPFVDCLRDTLVLASVNDDCFSKPYTLFSLTKLCSSFVTASILLSFSQPLFGTTTITPACVAYTMDLPRTVASLKERALIVAQNERSHNFDESVLSFPEEQELQEKITIPSLECFENNIVNKIPEKWTVISMTIDDTKSHLNIVRHEPCAVPFLLKLPLNRQNGDDLEDEAFTFRDAKDELCDIINHSDATVHRAREQPDEMKVKGAKSKWWAEREALDKRLNNLLVNIENIWFGGFCGVLSNTKRHDCALAKFQGDFDQILDNHLPSRQNMQRRGKSERITLGSQVMELFARVYENQGREFDLDEALTDLLYFVVDILQFNGESNAYDEIDFDSMIIETRDALETYHDTVGSFAPDSSDRHTVLILDKELHGFPWESLPCIDGQSISRLTSMIELYERLRMMEDQSEQSNPHEGIYTSPTDGAFILNPSGDLNKTQSRFEEPLSALTLSPFNWSHITARAPSEDEFFNAIANNPSSSQKNDSPSELPRILLYFGHGSGAQYIRSRRIKRLCTTLLPSTSPPTSTALLFGCSSASLREAGIFEPYGPLRAYLQAGAPAVLGSLWDVTDGDVDAFAMGVLKRWGLLHVSLNKTNEDSQHQFTTPDRGRRRGRGGVKGTSGRKKVKSSEDKEASTADQGARERESLSHSVARSRDECYLRYLNGAAMVVYGVPVYLGTSANATV